MKYVILIHSNPQPWGHPTGDFIPEVKSLPQATQDELMGAWEAVMEELSANGELLGGQALADPVSAKLYRWDAGEPVVTDGPYSEAKEHLAGFFLIDVESQERAEEVVRSFAGPGETVELRPVATY
ncbi:hypothetical protein FB381_0290 [Nocardioides albertanoniae]|uniref:YCII-related domain-containing protein n=1 Tax=Nocardioides albertanoniae TaxID=1175486 RepID=A0A543A1F6_9ACTN|nr:YciI family protein [Nocardioides albertanoniae]TQL66431.1 hypothetical protein FB381_0290 [Nocardioides albertanoniae]